MKQLTHVAFCGGGSGGHIIPAVAIAEELLQHNLLATVSFFTSGRNVDDKILQSCKLPQTRVSVIQQPVTSSQGFIKYRFAIIRSIWRCLRSFKQKRPDIVVGMGGFASVPGVIAAWWLRIPVALFESNTVVGRANRQLNRLAKVTMIGWPTQSGNPHAVAEKERRPIHWKTGVPVRSSFQHAHRQKVSHPGVVQLLIIGGSLGSLRLNQLVHAAFLDSGDLNDSIHVLHQTGETNLEIVRSGYDQSYVDAQVRPYIENMAAAMTQADLVISRAGALSLAELAAIGRASILIPLSTAADNHQACNAEHFAGVGAAAVVDETDEHAASHLRDLLLKLCRDTKEREIMAAAAGNLRQPDAACRVIHVLSEHCK